ncbi:hypothetical protein [Pelagibaculum spongiae]|uniref:Uncharacterized protein n=1 Tax=Pelagibaculum spongiae TaxID=2080658 RepID=A0A2V1GTB5_9GAMM|nr:hypothetical protein [Pelagibaculum spongiae]PVZ68915.1 hypothetical protein DC094_11725 [Pelagibaculum spongiae]
MSAVIKTLTPFTEQDVLLDALRNLGVSTTIMGTTIVTDRNDYQGAQKFIWNGNVYQFSYDSDELGGQIIRNSMTKGYVRVSQFLTATETEYRNAFQRKLAHIAEEDRQRLERERLTRVEAARNKAIEKAKSQGYRVKEQRNNGKIQLVLTRTVY